MRLTVNASGHQPCRLYGRAGEPARSNFCSTLRIGSSASTLVYEAITHLYGKIENGFHFQLPEYILKHEVCQQELRSEVNLFSRREWLRLKVGWSIRDGL